MVASWAQARFVVRRPDRPSRWLATLILSLWALASASGAEPAAQPPASKNFHLFLLIGQSNMAGRGKMEDIDRAPHPRVWKLNRAGDWTAAVAPLHFDKPKIAGTGLGGAFGRTLADDNPDIHIGLIPCAVGGTRISQWKKDGELYANAIARTRTAMQRGVLKGVLWHQGEGDAGSEQAVEDYIRQLTRLVHNLRTDLQTPAIPFIAGQLSRAWGDEKPLRRKFNILLLRHARHQTIPRFGTVLSQDISAKPDKTHFDSAGLRALGKRYAAAWKHTAEAFSNRDPGVAPLSIRFQGQPVSQAISVLAARAHVPYAVDLNVLEAPVWTQPYHAEFNNVTAGRALQALLAQVGLASRLTPGSNLQQIGKAAAPTPTNKPQP